MKNKILSLATFVAISMLSIQVRAQSRAQSSWIGVPEKLYTTPDSTFVGIGIANPSDKLNVVNGHIRIGRAIPSVPFGLEEAKLKFGRHENVQLGIWEAATTLSFKANKYNFTNGNVGIGVTNPQYKLDVNGKMFLRTYEWINSSAYSYLNWECHRLVMGVPKGSYAVTRLDLMSGGYNQDSLFSEFTMYTAYDEDTQVAKIQLNTMNNCWFNNTGYVGIGTTSPTHKLDVRGTIRADEILVNHVSGADFVFDKSYNLRPLSEVKAYVQQHQHLPEIPSAAEMQEQGVNMNELQMQLLQKVEELTLYIIQQDQRIKELEEQLKK